MASHICMHELAEPLQALVLPCLPPASLAALRGTCQAMHVLSDQDTGAIWLAAAARLFCKGAMDTFPSQPDAASVQAQLRAQAAAEAEIRTGGALCGRVAMTHLLHAAPSAQVQKMEWSPCGCWVAVHMADGIKGSLDVVSATCTSHVVPGTLGSSKQADSQQEVALLAGIPCAGFHWLGTAQGRLMIYHAGIGNAIVISVYSASTGARIGRSPSDEHPVISVVELSPCRTLLAIEERCNFVGFAFSVWDFASESLVRLQMPLYPPAFCAFCNGEVRWSHDSRFCALSVGWRATRDASRVEQLLIFTASGSLHQSLDLEAWLCKWSPTATLLAFVAQQTLKLWDVSTATLSHIPVGLSAYSTSIDWSPDGKYLALACPHGWIFAETSSRSHVSCIISAAGTICWSGRADVGCQHLSGLAHEEESRWSGNGAVCMGLHRATQTGTVVVPAQGNFTEMGTMFMMRSSISYCGQVVVSATYLGTWSNNFLRQGSTDTCSQPREFVSQRLSFQVPKDALCLAWHPSPRLSTMYAVLDATSNVWIMDGRSGTMLHSWSWQDLAGNPSNAIAGKHSPATARLCWSPGGLQLCVVQAAQLVMIAFG